MTALTVVPVRSSALRRFATRHPIAAFLTLFFLIAYPLMSLIALAALGLMPGGGLLARLPVAPDEVAGLVLTMGALFPAALYVTWATEGRSGVKRLIRRTVRWRFGLRWWLVILTALPLLTVAAGLLLGDSLRSVEPVRLLLHQVPLLLVNLLLVNLWEESAWAGFLQTRLERRHNVFTAALLTAVPFGFAHWPLALFDPTVSVGSVLVALPGYLLLGALVRPLLGHRQQPPRRRPHALVGQPHPEPQRHRGRPAGRRGPPARVPDRAGGPDRRSCPGAQAQAEQGVPPATRRHHDSLTAEPRSVTAVSPDAGRPGRPPDPDRNQAQRVPAARPRAPRRHDPEAPGCRPGAGSGC